MAKAKPKRAKRKLLVERGWRWIETDSGRDYFIGQIYDRKSHAPDGDSSIPDFRFVRVEIRELPRRHK